MPSWLTQRAWSRPPAEVVEEDVENQSVYLSPSELEALNIVKGVDHGGVHILDESTMMDDLDHLNHTKNILKAKQETMTKFEAAKQPTTMKSILLETNHSTFEKAARPDNLTLSITASTLSTAEQTDVSSPLSSEESPLSCPSDEPPSGSIWRPIAVEDRTSEDEDRDLWVLSSSSSETTVTRPPMSRVLQIAKSWEPVPSFDEKSTAMGQVGKIRKSTSPKDAPSVSSIPEGIPATEESKIDATAVKEATKETSSLQPVDSQDEVSDAEDDDVLREQILETNATKAFVKPGAKSSVQAMRSSFESAASKGKPSIAPVKKIWKPSMAKTTRHSFGGASNAKDLPAYVPKSKEARLSMGMPSRSSTLLATVKEPTVPAPEVKPVIKTVDPITIDPDQWMYDIWIRKGLLRNRQYGLVYRSNTPSPSNSVASEAPSVESANPLVKATNAAPANKTVSSTRNVASKFEQMIQVNGSHKPATSIHDVGCTKAEPAHPSDHCDDVASKGSIMREHKAATKELKPQAAFRNKESRMSFPMNTKTPSNPPEPDVRGTNSRMSLPGSHPTKVQSKAIDMEPHTRGKGARMSLPVNGMSAAAEPSGFANVLSQWKEQTKDKQPAIQPAVEGASTSVPKFSNRRASTGEMHQPKHVTARHVESGLAAVEEKEPSSSASKKEDHVRGEEESETTNMNLKEVKPCDSIEQKTTNGAASQSVVPHASPRLRVAGSEGDYGVNDRRWRRQSLDDRRLVNGRLEKVVSKPTKDIDNLLQTNGPSSPQPNFRRAMSPPKSRGDYKSVVGCFLAGAKTSSPVVVPASSESFTTRKSRFETNDMDLEVESFVSRAKKRDSIDVISTVGIDDSELSRADESRSKFSFVRGRVYGGRKKPQDLSSNASTGGSLPLEISFDASNSGIFKSSSQRKLSPIPRRNADMSHDSPSTRQIIANIRDAEGGCNRISPRDQSFMERPWQTDMVIQRVKSFGERSVQHTSRCQCSNSVFSGKDELVEFFLPLMGMACTCGKRPEPTFSNERDPTALENILRPWQVKFLAAFGIYRGDQLVKAHHRSAPALANALRQYRRDQGMTPFRTKSCNTALKIWAKTAKAFTRSIRQQSGGSLKVPNTLYILSGFLEQMEDL